MTAACAGVRPAETGWQVAATGIRRAGHTGRVPSDVVMVNGAAELSARAGHLFGSATQEIVCVARDLHTFAATRSSDETALARRVSAGLVVRKLFMSEALLDPESAASIERLDRAGAEVRITSVPVNQTIVIDRRVAILAGDPVPGDARTYSIVTDPGVIDGLLSLYRVAWQGATELAVAAVDLADVRAVAPQILGALRSGATDESAARALGMSVRTYRRRVASLMSAIGAESRFQAGVRARDLGLA